MPQEFTAFPLTGYLISELPLEAWTDSVLLEFQSGSLARRNTALALVDYIVTKLGTAATLNVGTGSNNIVQLNGSGQLPAVSGALLTGITPASIGAATAAQGALAGTAVQPSELASSETASRNRGNHTAGEPNFIAATAARVTVTASRNLAASDNGKLLYVNSVTDLTLTYVVGLGDMFSCSFIQKGAGKLTVAAGAGTTLTARGGLFITQGPGSMATLQAPFENEAFLGGNLG